MSKVCVSQVGKSSSGHLWALTRFLPSAPARLIDVGGGPGTYAAVWAPRRLGRPARPALRHPRVTIHSEATS